MQKSMQKTKASNGFQSSVAVDHILGINFHQGCDSLMLSCYDISATFSQNCGNSSKNQEGSRTCKAFPRNHFRSNSTLQSRAEEENMRPPWALSQIQSSSDGWIFLAALDHMLFERRQRQKRKCGVSLGATHDKISPWKKEHHLFI